MRNNKFKILIVTENRDIRNILIEFLSENNIEALGAESIKAAMTIFDEDGADIDLFIIDLKLADGNGIEFLEVLRSGREPNNSPAIIMNTLITENTRRIGRQLGVIAYFEKPFDLYALAEKISCAIGTKLT